MDSENPLLEPYKLPPLDKIKPEHFEPAIDHFIELAQANIASIKLNGNDATFHNTVVPLDRALSEITRIEYVLSTFTQSMRGDAVVDVEQKVSQKISAFRKAIFQDRTLAEKFQAVESPASAQDQMLYKTFSHIFESEGAFLPTEGQQRIVQIDDQLISLASSFGTNLEKGAKQQAVLFTDPQDIKGLPESTVARLRQNAQDAGHETGWLVIPERLQVDNLLGIAESRNFRQKVFEALKRVGTEAPYDNEPVIKKMLALRHERATLIGAYSPQAYRNHAEYALERNMAGKLDRVQELMKTYTDKALPKFEQSVGFVQAFAAENGGPRKLEPWDLPYWTNRYKQKAFTFDETEFSKYLPLDSAIDGFFKTAERVFGITFTENPDHPHYHPDVKTYDVTDSKTGESRGILYADFFARPGKFGGAWMDMVQPKEGKQPNIVSLNMNLMKPEKGKPVLLSLAQLSTLFHEGGHTIHGLLGTNTIHPSLQGPSGPSDYTEFFSMVMENWPNQKEVLDSFARHHETGAPIPDELFEAMQRSKTFLAERKMLLGAQNARRDFAFHTIAPEDYTESKTLEKSADFQHPLAALIRPYSLTSFGHLFEQPLSQYAAGYYGYMWSEGLAHLGFKPFEEKGVFDADACKALAGLYSYGCSRDLNAAYAGYHGKEVTPDALAGAILHSVGADKPLLRQPPSKAAERG